jgi:hypothetical protein
MNLAVCPKELTELDPNAAVLWPKLLRKVGVTISRGEHIEERRALILRSFGLPSLLQRLTSGMSERDRARIWWRECAACSEGDSIPDLTAENMHQLNPWIVTASEKYPDPRAARLAIVRGRPRKSPEEMRAANAARVRKFRGQKRQSKKSDLEAVA